MITPIRRSPKPAEMCAVVSLTLILGYFGGIFPGDVSGAELAQPFVDFKADVDLDIEDGEFEVMATFTLGKGSNGINLQSEALRLHVAGGAAAFTVTIPAGSYKKDRSGFNFQGTVNKVRMITAIRSLPNNVFEFEIEGERVNLKGVANPVTVSLIIGDDAGSKAFRAKIE